jgi:hypothetical protein
MQSFDEGKCLFAQSVNYLNQGKIGCFHPLTVFRRVCQSLTQISESSGHEPDKLSIIQPDNHGFGERSSDAVG